MRAGNRPRLPDGCKRRLVAMLVFPNLGAIAEFDRALIRERTVAGFAEARPKGKKADDLVALRTRT
jgi:DNA invertase Pin-like site-specific DNA recombinase